MKKILLGTTALMAAGTLFAASAQAAEPIKLQVGGFMNQDFGIVNNSQSSTTVDRDGTDIKGESEINFKGSTKLDNGITVGVDVQLEAEGRGDSSANGEGQNYIDESYIFVDGSFGRILIGGENNAAYLMHYRHNDAGGLRSVDEGTLNRWIIKPTGFTAATVTAPLQSNDRETLSYFTPRFEGFQIGASYIPAIDPTQWDNTTMPDRKAVDHDGVALGVNYDNKFDNVSVKLSATWEGFQAPKDSTQDDAQGWAVGGIVGFSGFTVGAAFYERDDDISTGSATSGDQKVWHLGAGYTMGATYVTVNYLQGEAKAGVANTDEDVTKMWMVSAKYTLGPGIAVNASIMNADYEGEDVGSGDDSDGWGAVVGISTSF